MITDRQFGRICLRRILAFFVPMHLAARTYSLFLMERIWPRIRRAILTQYRSPNTINMEIMFVPSFSSTVPVMSGFNVSLNTTDSRMMISMSGRE